MLYLGGDESGKRGTATDSKVAGRTRRKIVPIAPALMIAIRAGNPARSQAERVDDRTRLLFSNLIQPRVQILPVVIAATGIQEGPFGARLPQAHRPRLRLCRDPAV